MVLSDKHEKWHPHHSSDSTHDTFGFDHAAPVFVEQSIRIRKVIKWESRIPGHALTHYFDYDNFAILDFICFSWAEKIILDFKY